MKTINIKINREGLSNEEIKLSEKQIINILENKLINKCSKSEKKQVMAYAFGEEFMDSDDKGSLKEYK